MNGLHIVITENFEKNYWLQRHGPLTMWTGPCTPIQHSLFILT